MIDKKAAGGNEFFKGLVYIIRLREFAVKYISTLVFVVLVVLASILSPYFFSITNIFNILQQASIVGCLAVGQTFVILTGGIDLSVGSIVAISSVISAMSQAFGLLLSCLMGLGIGVAFGFLNGVLVTKGKLPPFIATLGTMGIARGVALTVTRGWVVTGITDEFAFIGGGYIGVVPFTFIIWIVVFLLGFVFIAKTRQGFSVFAIGGNQNATFLSGINVTKVKLLVYALSGLCAGLGGVLYTARMTVGQPTAGGAFALDSIAAVVVGGTNIFGGEGDMVGTVRGVLILQLLNNLLNLIGISPFIQEAVKGIIILVAVYMSSKKRQSNFIVDSSPR